MEAFWAKVNVGGSENACDLIRAFFEIQKPGSSITLKENQASMQVVFEESPVKIIDALKKCGDDNMEFVYPFNENDNNTKGISNLNKKSDEVGLDLKLQEIASKSTSYEDFKKSVLKWTNLNGKTEQRFITAVNAAETCNEDIGWGVIRKNSGEKYTSVTINNINQMLHKKGVECSTLCLIKAVVKYKSYDFENVQKEEKPHDETTTGKKAEASDEAINAKEETSYSGEPPGKEEINPTDVNSTEKMITTSETVPVKADNVSTIEMTPAKADEGSIIKTVITKEMTNTNKVAKPKKAKVKMACMPKIPKFEEMLGSLDKSLVIETRVMIVLSHMGLSDTFNNIMQNRIVKFVTTAIKQKEINIGECLKFVGIAPENIIDFRTSLTNFIKRFARVYDSKSSVKLQDFLMDLQKVILTEEEYKAITGQELKL